MKKRLKTFLNDLARYPLFIFVIWSNCVVLIFSLIATMLVALIMPHRTFTFLDGYLDVIDKRCKEMEAK